MGQPEKQILHFVQNDRRHVGDRQSRLHVVGQPDDQTEETRSNSAMTIAICAALVECLGMVAGVAWAITAPDRGGLFTRIAIVVALAVSLTTLFVLGMAFAYRARR